MRTSNVIVRPMARPAIDLKAPPGSAAVAKTTQTRKNVRIPSITTPCQTLTPEPSAGEPRLLIARTFSGNNQRSSRAPAVAPSSCTLQYTMASDGARRRVIRKPSVTAGLK